VKEQKEPPAGDSTFLPKLYFKKACQRTLDNTLFRYETIIYFLQDSDFNEENQLALYQIAINQQQAYKHKIEQETISLHCSKDLTSDLKPSKVLF
jgi:hypothetical protein